jgi:hypothetical protein
VIDLENESEATTFGPGSPATYLNNRLLKQGEFVKNYFATGHASLDNYIAQISGQAPGLAPFCRDVFNRREWSRRDHQIHRPRLAHVPR